MDEESGRRMRGRHAAPVWADKREKTWWEHEGIREYLSDRLGARRGIVASKHHCSCGRAKYDGSCSRNAAYWRRRSGRPGATRAAG